MTTVLMLLLGVVLTAGTFVFVSAEFSLVAVDQAVLDKKADEGDRGAASVLRATRTLSTQLSGAQVGITLTTILLGYTTQSALADLLVGWLGAAGLAWGLATGIAAFVAAAFINVFSMLFGELVPKNLALAHPMATAVRVVPFQMAFTVIARPIIWVLGGTANWVLARMGIEPQEEISSARSASELAALVEHSVEEGTFDTSTADLFVNTIRMSTLSAADIMTDRGRLHTLGERDSAQDVLDLAHETGHSRFPVIGDDSDDILGLVSLRRAVAVPAERRADVPVISSSLMTDAPTVPETRGCRWPSSSTNTAACPALSPSKMSSKKSSARSPMSTISGVWASARAPTGPSLCPGRCVLTNSHVAQTSTFPRTAPTTRSAASS